MNMLTIGKLPEFDYATTEALNSLATNLSFSGEKIQCVAITSRYATEGKTTVAFNLSRTVASLGKRVIYIDTDLRRSVLSQRYSLTFENENHLGLAHYLSGQAELAEVFYQTNIDNLFVVPVGRTVSSSLQLLTSGRLKTLIDAARSSADLIIIDTAPIGAIVDGLEIAKHCDGALVVVGYNQGRTGDLAELTSKLKRSNCQPLGAVLNNVPLKNYANRRYYYSRYGYYSSYYKKYEKDSTKKK